MRRLPLFQDKRWYFRNINYQKFSFFLLLDFIKRKSVIEIYLNGTKMSVYDCAIYKKAIKDTKIVNS